MKSGVYLKAHWHACLLTKLRCCRLRGLPLDRTLPCNPRHRWLFRMEGQGLPAPHPRGYRGVAGQARGESDDGRGDV